MPQKKALRQLPKLPPVKTYPALKLAVRKTLRDGKERARRAVEQEKVRTSWEIGHLILKHLIHHKERAEYGAYVSQRLAKELQLSLSQIKYMIEFARAYPIGQPAGQLPWTSHTALLSINDSKERLKLAGKAERLGWTRKQLRSELRKFKGVRRLSAEKVEVLREPKRGALLAHQIVTPKFGPYKGKSVYDLGFSTFYKPKRAPRKTKKLTAKRKTYTYRAFPMQVIDGDTFWAVVDLGYGVTTEQSLRLRGINSPELPTSAGAEAKEFLKKAFRKKKQEVIIQTSKSDKYDRYLADVWVGDTYLNQAILTEGLATLHG